MTSIYSTGTVSVTNGNAVVPGSGTAWAVALVTGGSFSCAGLSIPIVSVDSDTSLTLAYPWPGATAAGAAYAIQRDNSDAANVVDLFDKMSRVLQQLGLAGIHPDADGTIADRDAITLGVSDKGFIFLYAEPGHDLAFYRWSGTAWQGPYAVKGDAGTPGVGSGGYGLPVGGATAQFLRKASGTDGDSAWAAPLASEVSNDSTVSGAKVKDALNALSSSLATTAAGLAKRGTVRAATTANVTIATALNNGDTIDGVVLVTGDPVLVKSQAAPAENGIYIVGVTPARSSEYDTYNEYPGALIVVQEGTTLADTFWYCTSNVGGTLGTTAVDFSQMTISLADDSVTNAKLANMVNATVKGRSTAGTGDPEDLTMSQLKLLLLAGVVIREVLTANRTYYVRTDGSDSNNGLANVAGGAFLTVQKAIDTVYGLDLSIYNVTIQLQDATRTQSCIASGPFTGKGTVTIVGNTTTPANVVWSVTSGRCLTAGLGAKITVSGIEFRTTTSGECLVADGPGSFITVGAACRFGPCASAHLFAFGGGYIQGRQAYSIVGGANQHTLAQVGSTVDVQGITITLTGTPAFAGAFARATSGSLILLGFNTFTGTATGIRYQVVGGSGIDVNGGGASYLPGGTAGTADAATYSYYA
jgi:hypothetical protein